MIHQMLELQEAHVVVSAKQVSLHVFMSWSKCQDSTRIPFLNPTTLTDQELS